jgi:hypothetical protein
MATEGDGDDPTAPTNARYRNLGAAIAVYLGAYLVIISLTGQLVATLAGIAGDDLTTLLVGSLLFAVFVTVGGLTISTASIARTALASVVVLAFVGIAVASMVARVTGSFGGPVVAFTLANPFVMVVLGVGAGWLIVRRARVGWAALLLVGVLVPLPTLLASLGVASPLAAVVILLVSGIVGLLILAAGRPLR